MPLHCGTTAEALLQHHQGKLGQSMLEAVWEPASRTCNMDDGSTTPHLGHVILQCIQVLQQL